MRLFLASTDFGHHLAELKELTNNGQRMLFIFNARDGRNFFYRHLRIWQKRKMLRQLGFSAQELDLRQYFGRPTKLKKFIDQFAPDVIYTFGGNAFVLRRAFAASGFDRILIDDLQHDRYVYAGGSAGSIITHPQLKYYDNPDDRPNIVPRGYSQPVIWEGLNLTTVYTIPHVDTLWFRESAQIIRDALHADQIEPIELKESEVLIINGSQQRVLR